MKKIMLSALLVFMFVFAAIVQAGTWEYDFTKVKGDTWKKDWEVIKGEFELKDGALLQKTASGNDNEAFRCLAVTKWEVGDGTIISKVMHFGAGTNDALTFYRMKDKDNGYASRLQLDGYLTVGKISAGTHGHIKFVATPIVANKLYTVKIVLKGDEIRASVDDVEKVVVSDPFSSKGRIGFGMSRCGQGAALQYISVTGDGVTPTAVEPADKLASTWGALKK